MYDHERLPSVERGDLLDEELTIRSFDALSSPPTDLPARSTGLVFGPGGDGATAEGDAESGEAAADPDVRYDLVPTADLEHITAFTGPQLSFEFAVPGPVEDAVASHLTAPGAPWEQPRYENPADDVWAPIHRRELAERYDAVGEPAPVTTLVADVTRAVTSPDAPENEGLTTEQGGVESVALLESDPEAVPTFGGVAVLQGVPAGDHRLTVNGAGLAPHSETVAVSAGDGTDEDTDTTDETATDASEPTATAADDLPDGLTAAGVGGEIPLVAREDATKLAVDADASGAELTDLAVEDDFAGRLYDAPLSDADAVYIHRGGAYTTEVRDADDAVGAVRVNPGDESRIDLDGPRTGKASLARYLADIAEETRQEVAAVLDEDGDGDDDDDDRGNGGGGGPGNSLRGLAQSLEAIAEAADRAAERAEAGDRGQADASIEAVARRLERARERLAAARADLPPGLANAADNRFEQVRRRAEQARESEKL